MDIDTSHASIIRSIHTRFEEGSIHNEMLSAIALLYRTKTYSRKQIEDILVEISDSVRIRDNRRQEIQDTLEKFFVEEHRPDIYGDASPDLWGDQAATTAKIEQNGTATSRKASSATSIPSEANSPATYSPACGQARGSLLACTLISSLSQESDALLSLHASSPHIGIFRDSYTVKTLIRELYPDPEELLIVGMSKFQATVLPVKQVVALCEPKQSRFEFLVPNPAISPSGGTNKAGKPSLRCISNVKERRYIVIEFDLEHPEGKRKTLDCCAALGIELAKYVQLAMCVYSAGKSLHFWFHVRNFSNERDLRRFFAYAIRLGADPATWTLCQYIRFPEGRRNQDKSLKQTVIYYNPLALL